jgi:hypothetical protein
LGEGFNVLAILGEGFNALAIWGEGFNALAILGEGINALAILGEGFNTQTTSCTSDHQIRGESTLLFLYFLQTPVLCEHKFAVGTVMRSRLREVWAWRGLGFGVGKVKRGVGGGWGMCRKRQIDMP